MPDWFRLSEEIGPSVYQRLSFALSNSNLDVRIRQQPLQALWHLLNVLFIANTANREGMHANALSITRQCIECISVVELGVCGHPQASDLLLRWNSDNLRPGELRAWLERNVWPVHGAGLWTESWSDFMTALARSLQPYAHYSAPLSQWYGRLHDVQRSEAGGGVQALLEVGPKLYDPQKATRITLYHALVTFTLARICASTLTTNDEKFCERVEHFRVALGKSRYFDGDGTKWEQQFWAMMWFEGGNPE